jgi:phenylacetate-CoA ligase
MNPSPHDGERYPTLTQDGHAMLRRMREHPAAPRFRNESGNRLLADEVVQLRCYEQEMLVAPMEWRPGVPPAWMPAFVEQVQAQVPYYRAHGRAAAFADIRPIDRGDLAADIARFVPDSQPLERLINFRTTGTTGHPLLIPSHPLVAARYLAYHKRAMARFGITLQHGSGQVGVMLLGMQQRCFTYVSVTPTMDQSGLAKINLHPDDWRQPEDRARYIDQMQPEVIAGDPISFATLLELPLTHRPSVLLSVSMALSSGLRSALQARFGCPVLDLYSMNEAGPLAVYDDACGGHVLLQPGMYVEIFDDEDNVLPPGQLGEITLSGGFNFCLPLLRYRTGDRGALAMCADGPMIFNLQGRRPVRYRTAQGHWINNIDLTHALAALPLSRFRVHQTASGEVVVHVPHAESRLGDEAAVRLRQALQGSPVTVALMTSEDKVLQYTTDLTEGVAT